MHYREEYKYYYLSEEKALEEFRKELRMREIVARTPLCPKTKESVKCSECPICEKKVEEFERKRDGGELDFLLLKMQMYR